MADTAGDLDRALAAIYSADLVHPDGALLECFLLESIDPQQAACYLLRKCLDGRDHADLAPLLSDWKQLVAAFSYEGPVRQLPDNGVAADITARDGDKCCITGLSKSFWDPLVVARILPRTEIRVDESLREMLGVFVGPDLRDWILSDAASENAHRNHWLARESAAAAWSQGFFKFTFSEGSKYYVSVVTIGSPPLPSIMDKISWLRHGSFKDHSASGMDTPDVSALQIRSRFAKPFRWSLVAREMAGKNPKRQSATKSPFSSLWRYFSDRCTPALTMAWRLVPPSIRIRAYHGLAFLGAHIYGSNCSMNVQQLPFGMYLKMKRVLWHQSLVNEYGALQLVRRHTHVPVPRPLDLLSDGKNSYLLTSRVPGVRLGACIDRLSDDDVKGLTCDLQKCLAELRAIPKVVAPEHAITNALGGACYDHRINAGLDYDEDRGDFVGPFRNEDEFNETLRPGALPHVSHRSGHKIVFTHGDLNLRNVLMYNGRFSGIVDWENSGWYPEYWDYTKAHYVTKLSWRWLRIVDEVFKAYGDFENELATERQFWEYCF